MYDQGFAKSVDILNLPDSFYDDPYPTFEALRAHDPVHQNDDGTVILTRYKDNEKVWRDLTASVDKSVIFTKLFGEGPLLEHWTHTMLFRDPPEHKTLRKLAEPFFSRKNVPTLRGFVEETVDGLIDTALEKKEFDFVADFAFQLPMLMICKILGVPKEDREQLHEWGARTMFCINPGVSREDIAIGHDAVGQFSAYLAEHLNERRSRETLNPDADVMSALAQAERDGAEVSEADLIHICVIILNGGHETTVNTMAVGLHSLLDQPECIAQYRNEDVSKTAPDELIRFVTPIQLQGRRVTQSLVLPSGVTLPPETEVVLCPASANRDSEVFDAPNRIDLKRERNRHLSFGSGMHLCLGRLLAKMEVEIAMPKIWQAFRTVERLEDPVFNHNVRFRGLSSLKVTVSD